MNFELDDTQQELFSLVGDVLAKEAGPLRMRAVLASGGYDHDLERSLGAAGLLDLFNDPDAGPLEAALVVERVGANSGLIAVGTRCLILPALGFSWPGPVALASRLEGQTIRYGEQAATVLVLTDNDLIVASPQGVSGSTADFGVPVAQVALERHESLGSEAARTLARWWRIALSLEIVGTAEAALKLTTSYVTDRFQFGRPLGSHQTVQHRLSEIYVALEGTRWLSRYAAYLATDDEAAAVAAGSATELARRSIWELHQLTGAIGFTKEYDLQLMTMTLHALRLEMDGVSGSHSRSVTDLRWGSGAA